MGNLAFIGSHKINGVSALHTDLMRKTVFHNLNTVYPGPHRQQDERHHLPPLADRVQSGPRAASSARPSASGRWRTPRRSRVSPLSPTTAGVQDEVAAARRAAQGRARALHRGPARPAHRSGFDVRRPDQAHPRVQAPASQHPRDGRALQRDPRQSDHRLRAAGEDLRRQGGGELHSGQAHHQARHRRRPGRQLRPDRARASQGRVPAELQRLARRDDHSRRRPVGADLDRRDGGLRHRQHEDGAERRADDRDPRRRQRRVARPRRRRQHLHLRSDRRRGRGRAALRASTRRARIAALAALARGARRDRARASSPSTTRVAIAAWSTRSPTTTISCSAPTSTPIGRRRCSVDEAWRDRARWMRSSIINTANVGWFSSDRTIAEYAKEIWNAPFKPLS